MREWEWVVDVRVGELDESLTRRRFPVTDCIYEDDDGVRLWEYGI